MPEEIKPTGAAAAAPPTTPQPPAATPPPSDPPAGDPPPEVTAKEPVRDPDLEAYSKSLGFVLESDEPPPAPASVVPPKTEKTETTPTPAKPDEKPPVVPAAAPAPEPKVKVTTERPVQEVIDETISRVLSAQRQASPSPATAPATEPVKPPVDPDADYLAGLGEPERAMVRVLDYAAEKSPEFKGVRQQFVGFWKKLDSYIQKGRNDDPERTFDENDEDLQKWIRRNTPKVSQQRLDQIRMDMVKGEAVKEAEQKLGQRYQGEIQELRQRQHVLETRPRVEARAQRFADDALKDLDVKDDADVKEVIETARTKGWDKAEEENPLLVPLARKTQTKYARRASELLATMNGLKVPDANNPDHQWLMTFLNRQTEAFLASGDTIRVVEGRRVQFVPRGVYFQLPPEQRAAAFTFTDEDLLAMMQAEQQKEVVTVLKEAQNRLKKSGYERKRAIPPPVTSAKTEETPPAEASPRAPGSSAPGLASGSVKGASFLSTPELQAMGLAQFAGQ